VRWSSCDHLFRVWSVNLPPRFRAVHIASVSTGLLGLDYLVRPGFPLEVVPERRQTKSAVHEDDNVISRWGKFADLACDFLNGDQLCSEIGGWRANQGRVRGSVSNRV
jgi:hypothetical protein